MRGISVALLICLGTSLTAEQAPPGAVSCTGCHALFEGAPNPIQGMSADDIDTAMAAFRDGTRAGTVMPRLAAGFTAAESRAIAEWFANQDEVTP